MDWRLNLEMDRVGRGEATHTHTLQIGHPPIYLLSRPLGTCIHTHTLIPSLQPSAYTVGAIMGERLYYHNLDILTPHDLLGYVGGIALSNTITPAAHHNVKADFALVTQSLG